MLKKILLAAVVAPGLALSQPCVLQSKNVSRSSAVIQERSAIRADVVPALNGGRRCMVSFQARIDSEWHSAFGEYEWPGDRPRDEACAVAVKRAEDSVRERVSASKIVSENVLICTDNNDMAILRQSNPGTLGRLSQFRPHPDRPNRFWHNGTQCRYFLESQYVKSDIRTWEGVICQINQDDWVVVDKF